MRCCFASISLLGPFFSLFVIAWCTVVPVCIVIPALFATNWWARWLFYLLAGFLSGEVLLHFICASCISLRLGKRLPYNNNNKGAQEEDKGEKREYALSLDNTHPTTTTATSNFSIMKEVPSTRLVTNSTTASAPANVGEDWKSKEHWWREVSRCGGGDRDRDHGDGGSLPQDADIPVSYRDSPSTCSSFASPDAVPGWEHPNATTATTTNTTSATAMTTEKVMMTTRHKHRALIRLAEEEVEMDHVAMIMRMPPQAESRALRLTQDHRLDPEILTAAPVAWYSKANRQTNTSATRNEAEEEESEEDEAKMPRATTLASLCSIAFYASFLRRRWFSLLRFRRPVPEVDPSVLHAIHSYIAFTDGLKPEQRRHMLLDAPRRFCEVCHRYKAPREHHCSICRTCVPKMDHHCVWIDNCVDVANQRFFISMIFWVLLACSVEVVLLGCGYVTFRSAERQLASGHLSAAALQYRFGPQGALLCSREVVRVWLAAGFLVLAMLVFLYFHLPGLLSNTTCIESEILDGKHQLFASSSFVYHNPYDLRWRYDDYSDYDGHDNLVVGQDNRNAIRTTVPLTPPEPPHHRYEMASSSSSSTGWLTNILEVYGRPHWRSSVPLNRFCEREKKRKQQQQHQQQQKAAAADGGEGIREREGFDGKMANENDGDDEHEAEANGVSWTRSMAMAMAQRWLPCSIFIMMTVKTGGRMLAADDLDGGHVDDGNDVRSQRRYTPVSGGLLRRRVLDPLREASGIAVMLLWLLIVPIFDDANRVYDGIYYPVYADVDGPRSN